jgi:hypothetical protein
LRRHLPKSYPKELQMLTYFSALLSDDQNALRLGLLAGAVAGGIAVGVGIYWETKKLNAATITVLVGVIVEAVCTIGLFVVDEGISRAQQHTIAQLLTPRRLNAAHKERIAAVTKSFPSVSFLTLTEAASEPWHFALDVSGALRDGGWDWRPFPGIFALQPLDGRPSEGTTVLDHIEIQATPTLMDAGTALGEALRNPDVIGMEKVEVVGIPNADWVEPNAKLIIIAVGSKR